MDLSNLIQEKLVATFSNVENISFQPVSGGSINQAFRISFSGNDVFCKINSATKFPHLFDTEKSGLLLLSEQNIIRTASVIDCFTYNDKQVLLLHWIREGNRTESFWTSFGEQLALLHQQQETFFGLDNDNYMGSVPQSNSKHSDWSLFFAAERLAPMVKRCADASLLTTTHHLQFEQLEKRLASIFDNEPPSLLHGDLWSGNFMCNQNAEPVLIDPAVYYGHRSMDLAMTTLFGGFSASFYEAYHYHYPFPTNYKEQWAVCNLYPLLIHLYLFGNSYLPSIEKTFEQFD